MAVIPDAPALGARSTPQPSRQIANYDAGIMARGMQQAGQAISAAGAVGMKAAKEQQDAQDKFEAAQAALMLKEYHINKVEEYRQRPNDYANFSDDYKAGYGQAYEKAKSLIKNPAKRQQFDLLANETYLDGSSSVMALGRGFESDANEAYGLSALDAQKRSIMTNPTLENLAKSKILMREYYTNAGRIGKIKLDRAEALAQSSVESLDREYLSIIPKKEALDLVRRQTGESPLSVRNNNPGNLRGADGNFRSFSTPQAGLAAMRDDLTAKLSGKSNAMKANYGSGYTPTIRTIISTYAPKSENDTEAYIATVARETGLDPDQKLTVADVDKIMKPMIKVEGGGSGAKYYDSISPDVAVSMMPQLRAGLAADLHKDMDDMNEIAKHDPNAISDATINSAIQTALDLDLRNEHEKLVNFRDSIGATREINGMTLADARSNIAKERESVKAGDAKAAFRLSAKEEFYNNKVSELNKDFWGSAQKMGIVTLPEGDVLTSENPADVVSQRAQQVEVAKQKLGQEINPALITSQEVDQLKTLYDSGQNIAPIITRLGAGLDYNQKRRVASEIAKKDKVLAVAMAQDDPSVAARIIAGGKAESTLSRDKFKDAAFKRIGGAFATGEVRDSVIDGAYALYKQMQVETGDSMDDVNEALFDSAISQAVGEIEDVSVYGTSSKILVPQSMSAYDLVDRLQSVTRDDLEAAGGVFSYVPYAESIVAERLDPDAFFKSNTMFSYGNGKYGFRNKATGEIVKQAKNPREDFVLDVNNISVRRTQAEEGVINAIRTGASGGR